jgi:hypothetical protein
VSKYIVQKPTKPIIAMLVRLADLRIPQLEYPEYRFEAGFSEEDKLWDPEVRESNEHRDDRLRGLLNDIFAPVERRSQVC